MATSINNSIDWSTVESILLHQAHGLKHEADVKHMIQNIRKSVTELSRAEVEARRGKKHRAAELLEQVNKDIETVEGFLLMAALLG